VSVSAVLYPRWPPWLKIEISSNGQNCSILSQKVPKFELYKHNDELFNIYYGCGHLGYRTALTDTILKGNHPRIISAKFGWYWHSSFRGEEFFFQKVPKFELYKHNDELFNLYYGIFYELWTFAYFDRLCKLEKRGDEIKKKSSLFIFSHGGHLGYRKALTDTILKGDHPRIISAKFGWDWHSSFRTEDLMSFLTYITGLFMNFELLSILTDYAN
jgi:hypothetical protein